MAEFRSFRGVRYDLDRADLADVTAPPYDVIGADDRAALIDRHPDNVVRIDLPGGGDTPDPYRTAASLLDEWRREGILVTDPDESLYVYRMDHVDETGTSRHTTGVFGALTLAAPGQAADGATPILPHEYTTPKAKSDRLDLMRATAANLSAVWALSPASGLTEALDVGRPPMASWSDGHGVHHALWQVTDRESVDAICELISSHPVVIADGHHRYETALTYQAERHAAGDGPGAYDAALFFVVELSEDELDVLGIHRLLSGLPDDIDLLESFAPFFDITDAPPVDASTPAAMAERESLVLVGPGRAWFLEPRAELLATARPLDTSRLDVALAALPPHELVYQHGVDHVVDAVTTGRAQYGVLVRPVSVADIVEVAHGGERMPPKSTFFHPKPATGVVFRCFDRPT